MGLFFVLMRKAGTGIWKSIKFKDNLILHDMSILTCFEAMRPKSFVFFHWLCMLVGNLHNTTMAFESVCHSEMQKLDQKRHNIRHDFDNVTITLFLKVGRSS